MNKDFVTFTRVPTALQSIPSGSLPVAARVAMAAVSYYKPHLIILDEPTNNLDLESCESLAKAISDFKGDFGLARSIFRRTSWQRVHRD